MYDPDSLEKILEVYKIKGNDDEWCPAVKIISDHSGDAIWVAALMYNVYSRYLETIPDADQHQFEKDVRTTLSTLFEIGMEHIDNMPHDQ
jgi:hypothetical protein